MRDLAAASFSNACAPAPQAPARNPSPRPPSRASLRTFDSHRKLRRPKIGDRKVYRPVRRHTLSRIDEAPTIRSLQPSTDISTRPILRSRSNVSADTSRSVPVCNASHELGNQLESSSPQYAEPSSDSDSFDRPASMTDQFLVPFDPTPGGYVPSYAYYRDERLTRPVKKTMKKLSKRSNLYLAFMY